MVKFFFILFTFSTFIFSEEGFLVSSNIIDISRHDSNVKFNLKKGLEKIIGQRLAPKSSFSFNKIVGDASLVNGYLPARVYDGDEVALEAGGGICILASSIFNSLLLAGFSIEERHKHSRPVSYIESGLDATILYGRRDLKMKNLSTETFWITGELSNSKLILKVYSNSEPKKSFSLRVQVQKNSTKANESASGKTVKVYRESENELELLYSDFILPVSN
ncbi:MAG: VanW family protein [Leptospiraceae bacterium]|nr:VanW family protein [Leptospiraceae bacterium]